MNISENITVNPIDTTLQGNSKIVKIHQNTSEIHHFDNDLSLLSPKIEQDFTNPSVIVDFGNSEKDLQDIQKGAGEDVHKGLPSIQQCKNTIAKIKYKKANGEYKKESTFENALQMWERNLQLAQAREGLKK